ncbi:MAG TPA: beta-galactosidase [Polyangiales bacterium]|nr:beta-galactosidase [Polyangiales bacterium]
MPRIAGRTLALGALRIPLSSGAVHYFQLKPSAWKPALEACKRLGLPMIESYVPWGVHEAGDGSFDFGSREPNKDLGAFLDLAHSLGLFVMLRPGPNINAELTYFGLPERIVYDEACQARSPRGNALPFIAPPRMFPVPSYASEKMLRETHEWLGEVAKVVRPRLWPDGPVVMLQVDNEAALYFRDGPYDQDYHPDAVAKYREFLRTKHGSLGALSEAYGMQIESWDLVDPPVAFDGSSHAELRRRMDWVAFHEELIGHSLERMRASLREHGLGDVPLTHNLPLGEAGLPAMLARLDRDHDLCGLDYYHRRQELTMVRDRTLRLVGTAGIAYSPEMGLGAPLWFAPRSDDDALHTLLCSLAYGLRGMNLYMAVDRDRWYGAPIDEDGHERPQAAVLQRLFTTLTRVGFHELTRKVEVGIVLPKEYAQLSRASHLLGALSPTLLELSGMGASAASSCETLGFAEPIQTAWPQLVTRFARALAEAGVPYVLIESDAAIERFADLRVVIAPSYELVDAQRWQRLYELSQRGVHVVYGPREPELDAALRPRAFPALPNATRIDAAEQTDAEHAVQSLIAKLSLARPFPCSPRSVDVTVHEDANGASVLFVVHPDDALCAVEVSLPEPMTLIDVLNDERYEGETSLTIPMAARSCRMFTCEPRKSTVSDARGRSKPPSARRSSPPPC